MIPEPRTAIFCKAISIHNKNENIFLYHFDHLYFIIKIIS